MPVVARGKGALLWDTTGKRYIDGSGGAIVTGIGHGVEEVVDAVARQAKDLAYAHGTAFSSAPLIEYADALSEILPFEEPRIYPVSGGSEAVETALKMARAYHLARGESRHIIISRFFSYHGNTRGAMDISGRKTQKLPYQPWLGQARHTFAPYEYRCPFHGTHPIDCASHYAEALDQMIIGLGTENVAAFIAEPLSGATLGAAIPPDGYWEAIRAVCRKHGVLLIMDEVMTGFGRTGDWFASDYWGVRPDIMTVAKGAASGYWPLGLAVASGHVHETIMGRGFNHGFTYSHHPLGAVAGLEVLRYLQKHDLPLASRQRGDQLHQSLIDLLDDHPHVGDIRGRGLLIGIELVKDRDTKAPFPRSARVIERVVRIAKDLGAIVYSSVGCADGLSGDLILLGPPLVITPEQVGELANKVAEAIATVLPR